MSGQNLLKKSNDKYLRRSTLSNNSNPWLSAFFMGFPFFHQETPTPLKHKAKAKHRSQNYLKVPYLQPNKDKQIKSIKIFYFSCHRLLFFNHTCPSIVNVAACVDVACWTACNGNDCLDPVGTDRHVSFSFLYLF
jgi:hypothetical protein